MPEEHAYDIATQPLFDQAQLIDVTRLTDEQQPWWNRTLCAVNDAWVRVAVMEGDFHWHKHDAEDEFFFVLDGQLDLELEDRTISLDRGKAYTVPAGVMHFPHARGRTVVMMIETAGVVPTGD